MAESRFNNEAPGESWEPSPLNYSPPTPAGMPPFRATESSVMIRDHQWSPLRIISEGFKHNNIFASVAASDSHNRAIRQAEGEDAPDIDPFEIGKYSLMFPLEYVGLTKETSVYLTDRRIREELLSKQIMQSNGWYTALGSLAGAVTDPLQVAVPFGALKTGIGFARGFKTTATPTFLAMTLDEMILSDTQPTRSAEESMMNVVLSTGVVGIFGGIAGQFGSKYVNRLSKQYLDDVDNFSSSTRGGPGSPPFPKTGGGREVHPGADDTRPIFKGTGAAATREGFSGPTPREEREAAGLAPAFGLERLPDTPFKRLLMSPITFNREVTAGLIESPGLFYNANFQLQATEVSVETKIATNWLYDLVETLNVGITEYASMRGHNLGDSATEQVIGRAKLGIQDTFGKSPDVTEAQYREQTTIALRNNEAHENPNVVTYAKRVRKLLNRLRDEAIDAGLFTAHHRSNIKRLRTEIEALEDSIKGVREAIGKQREIISELEKKIGDSELATGTEAILAELQAARKKLTTLQGIAKAKTGKRRQELKKEKSLQENIDRIEEEGPTVFNEEGYVPRIWRIDKIEANEAGFREVIGKYLLDKGVPLRTLDKELDLMLERIRRDHDFGALGDNNPGIARSARERLIDLPDSALFEFIENDIETILRAHVRTFATDLEIVKRFDTVDMYDTIQEMKRLGEEYINSLPAAEKAKAKKILEQNINDIGDLRDRLRGTYGLPDDPYRPLSRFYRVMKQWNYISMLGGVVLSALPDLARPMMTEGFHRVFGTSYALLQHSSHIRKLSQKETHRSGTGADMVMNTRALAMSDMWGDVFGRQTGLEKILHRGAEAFSMINLLNPWNAAIKEWAGSIVASRIFESADLWVRGNEVWGKYKQAPHDFVKLARSGIDLPMAQRIMKEFYKHGDIGHKDGTLMRDILKSSRPNDIDAFIALHIARARKQGSVFLANTDAWDDLEAVMHFRAAVKQDVDRTIVTPGAADRPLWMSTELGSVISQFKGFAVGAAQRVLISGLQERQAYNLYGLAMLVGMGVFVNQLKKDLSGYEYGQDSLPETILAGIDRSGALGYFTDIERALAAFSNNSSIFQGERNLPDRVVAGSILGPTASRLIDLRKVLSDTSRGEFGEGTAGAIRRMFPLNNHFALNKMFDEAQQAAR